MTGNSPLSPAAAATLSTSVRAPILRYHPLILILAAMSLGITLDRLGSIGLTWWLGAAALLGVGWWGLAWRRQVRLASLALLGMIAALAGAWHQVRWQIFDSDEIGLVATEQPTPVCLEAILERSPQFLPARSFDVLSPWQQGVQSRLPARVMALREAQHWRTASGRLLVRVDGHLLGLRAGDRVRLRGTISAPAPPLNPGEFDFAAHRRSDRVLAELRVDHPAAVEKLDDHPLNRALVWRYRRLTDGWRMRAQAILHDYLDDEHADLADALLLGFRERLSYEQNAAYFRSGMIHLLSISGVHVGILAMGLMLALRWGLASRDVALLTVAATTTGYALMIDAEPPAVRATILVVLTCLGLRGGRELRPYNLLAAAACVVLVLNPTDLFRTGPQLSFLAAGALAHLAQNKRQRVERDPLDQLIASTRPWPIRASRHLGRQAGEMFVVSLVIWFVSLPLIVAQFHLVSPIGLLLTPLLAAPIALALYSGFGILLGAVLFPPLAGGAAWLFARSIDTIEAGIAAGLNLPLSHRWTPGLSLGLVALFYGVVFLSLAIPKRDARPRRGGVAVMALASFMTLAVPEPWARWTAERELRCTFFAVGHGCSVLIELPYGRKMLYDAGRLGPPAFGAQSIASALFSRRVRALDDLVISHADIDHYNAVPELLERVEIKNAWLSRPFREEGSTPTCVLLSALERHGIASADLAQGDRLLLDPACSIRVLHPPASGTGGSDNSNSIVLLIEYLGRRVLLSGDLETPGLEQLLSGEAIDVELLLAPHHGSIRSSPAGIAAWCRPEWVVISNGRPAESAVRGEYETSGATVLETARDGAITVRINEQGLHVSAFRQERAGGTSHSRLRKESQR